MITLPILRLMLAVALVLGLPLAASASAYTIEMVIFERPGGGGSEFWPEEPGAPDPGAAIGPLPARSGLPKSLGPAAYTLGQRGMNVIRHLVWQQTPRGRNSKAWYWLDGAQISGLVQVSRGRFLHFDTDLLFRDPAGKPVRVRLHRRMRSDELHYIDHPKLGILIQARPAASAAGIGPAIATGM
jgi:hypothetical protein